ncbi:MAG: VCBS repeat-containing protein [Caldilineaceae bacterium]|nr:VCBS repeat-containing protein [Caldilineaceae bacterium]
MNRIRSTLLTLCCALSLATLGPSAALGAEEGADVVPTTFTSTSLQIPSAGIIQFSSPTLADLTGDDIPEIIIGTTRGSDAGLGRGYTPFLVTLRGNNQILWQRELTGPVNSSPSVGDLDGDGAPEIVVTTGGDVEDTKQDGALYVFDKNGNERWHVEMADHYPRDGYGEGAFSTPALCDLEGDGRLEIIWGGWDQRIYVYDADGTARWFGLNRPPNFPVDPGYYNADTIWSSPACADLNADGLKEIVIGADITGGGTLPDGTRTKDGGFLYVFDKDGNALVRRFLPEAIYSSPAIGDLNNDGRMEIAVGTGWFWWNAHGRKDQPYVYVFDTSQVFSGLPYADENKLPFFPGWPQKTALPGFSSPALADLDQDGTLEVIIGAGNPLIYDNNAGMIYVWKHNGQLMPGWPVAPKNESGGDSTIWSSPTVADVDGDGSMEILFSMVWDVHIYNADGQRQNLLKGYYTVSSSPAIGDTNGDGLTDIWIGSSNAVAGQQFGYVWHYSANEGTLGETPWPMFHRTAAHDGCICLNAPAKVEAGQDAILVLKDINDSHSTGSAILHLMNKGGSKAFWGAQLSAAQVATSAPNVTIQPEQGTLAPKQGVDITISIDFSGLEEGIHDLGTLKITSTDEVNSAQSSVLSVPLRVYYGPLTRTFLPTVQR